MKSLNQLQARREFLREAARYGALGAVAAVSALLVGRGAVSSPQAPCVNRGLCGRCAVFGDCQLPRARAVRRGITAGAEP